MYFLKDYVICMCVLCACVSVCHMHASFPQRSEKGVQFPGTGILGGCEHHVGAGN